MIKEKDVKVGDIIVYFYASSKVLFIASVLSCSGNRTHVLDLYNITDGHDASDSYILERYDYITQIIGYQEDPLIKIKQDYPELFL